MCGHRRGGPYLCASSFCAHRDRCRLILLPHDLTKPMFIIVLPERKPPRQGQRGCRKMGWLAAPARALIVRKVGRRGPFWMPIRRIDTPPPFDESAGFAFLPHSHMLRHSCGYKLANDGQDTRAIQHYLGHRSIASTVRYTALAPDRFKGFWKD